MAQNYYSTTQCERMLLSYLAKNKQDLATYSMSIESDVFTTQARAWIFLILKKNYLYSKSLTSKEMFYIEIEQQLDARQEKYGKEIVEELDIIFSLTPQDSIELVIRKLQEAHVAAQLANVMQTTHGYLSAGNVEEAIDTYKRASMQISLSQKQRTVSGLFANADEWLQDVRNRKEKPQQYAGLKTGFTRFDDMTGGLFPAELTIFFGLSGKGKSTVMKNIVDRVVKSGHNVLFVPNEENKRQVETKFISLMTNIPGYLFKNGKFDDKQYELVDKFLHNKGNMGEIYIQPINQGVDATVIERQFNQLAVKGIKIDLIVVDYLDLMGSPFKTYSEWDEQGKITNSLKQLAINCNVPVVTCTQAAIESEKEQKKDNPFLTQSQVYGAKAKVHTANTLIGLVNKTASNDITPDTNNNPIHKIVLCVCKNRDGACFAFRQNMYARTGLMVNDDEQISLTQAQAALQAQLEKVKELDKQFSKNNDIEKSKIQKQLDEMRKLSTQDDDFEDQNFDYLADVPAVSDEQIKQKMIQRQQRQQLNDEQLQEFLDQFENQDKFENSSVSSDSISSYEDEISDESFLDQLQSVQTNVNVQENTQEQVQQEQLFQEQPKQQKKQLSAYELFKLRNKK